MHCEICNSSTSEPVQELFALPSITSDCRRWTAGRSVRICSGCGVMKRELYPLAKADFANIYRDYKSYPEPKGRTGKILKFIKEKIPKPESILDVGCGTGDGLITISNYFPLARVNGYEPTIHAKRPEGKYDLITLFHVLEHVEDLHATLRYIKSSLSEYGHVLIQVPYTAMGPFDLVIADHVWHFTKEALMNILDKCGFLIDYIGNDIIRKEITVLAYSAFSRARIWKCEDRSDSVDWLLHYKSFLDNINEKVAIYGTGPAAAWVGGILGDKVVHYYDDDEDRVGKEFNCKMTYRHNRMYPSINFPVIAPFPEWQLPEIKAKNPSLRFLEP